ncbi:MAG: hypothetical protein LUO81_03150, partial [Methanoregulaceae archaeon]|nr:hypothetical protein [Methanoregulaceae archaeon]
PFALPSLKISHQDLDFMLIHDPEEVPQGYEGWVIHGHLHNNDLTRFPFINTSRKTINVSAELVNYTPVSLDEIAGFVGTMQEGDQASTLTEARKKFGNKG